MAIGTIGMDRKQQRLALAAMKHAVRNDDVSPGLSEVDPESLELAASAHGVSHVVLDWLLRVAPQHPAATTLRSINRDAAMFNLKVLGALRNALEALPPDLETVAFKGPVLASLSRTTSVRAYGDLDLLVAPDRFEEAYLALQASGATLFPYGSWQSAFETRHAEIPMILSFGVPLDLHAHVCSRPYMRQSYRVDEASALLERRRMLDLGSGRLPVMSLEDMLLHTACHSGWSGGERLGWLVDLDSVIRSGDVDWDVVVRRARDWQVRPLVNDALLRTRTIVGTDVPAEVLRQARRDPGSAILRVADMFDPPQACSRERGLARLLRLDTRESVAATAAAFGHRLSDAARLRFSSTQPTDIARLTREPEVDDQFRDDYLGFIGTLGR